MGSERDSATKTFKASGTITYSWVGEIEVHEEDSNEREVRIRVKDAAADGCFMRSYDLTDIEIDEISDVSE